MERKMKYINLCPHDIHIVYKDTFHNIPMSKHYVNLEEKWSISHYENNNGIPFPIYKKEAVCYLIDYSGNIIDYNWKPKFNKKYIVSAYIKNTLFPDCDNVYAPGKNIKNNNRKVIGCIGLTNKVIGDDNGYI